MFSRQGEGYQAWCRLAHKQYDALRYDRLRVKRKAQMKAYDATHPDRKKEARMRRDGRKSGRGISAADEKLLRGYFNGCVVCGASDDVVLDHVKPLAMGGVDEPENVQLLCAYDNKRKGDKHIDFRPRWRHLLAKSGRDPGEPPFAWS